MALLMGALFAAPASAITESEVEAQAAASGKEAVVGNVLIWFLCAVGFLKVSQKIDSFMQGIGLNVGHTGGSLLAEALIATRGIKMVTGGGGHTSGGNHSGAAGGNGIGSYFKGGLVGMASRRAANNAVKTATSNTTVNSPAFSSSSTSAHSSHKASNTAKSTQNTAQSVRHDGQGPIAAQSSSLGEMPRLSDQTGQAPVFAADSADVTATPATVDLTVPHEPAPINAPSREPAQTDILRTDTERTDFEPRDASPMDAAASTAATTIAAKTATASETEAEPPIILYDAPQVGMAQNTAAAEVTAGVAAVESAEQASVPPDSTPIAPTASDVTLSEGGDSIAVNSSEQMNGYSTERETLQGGNGTVIQTGPVVKTQTNEQSSAKSYSRASTQSSTVNNGSHTTHSAGRLIPSVHNSFKSYGIGGAMFMKSLSQGGGFANEVISRVARGDIQSTGTITGEMASHALNSYMGITAMGKDESSPALYNVEIGGGRISGVEVPAGTHQDVQFCMYDAAKYNAPEGEHTKVVTADGATWYKQYEQDAVDRKPYHAPDGTIAYNETIVKRMPHPPQRKDRM
ncbi:MAG: hypothetical protein E7425_03175 [Ruminococcaceae bacterium]|nr:hypothetical protein [Oscillospiraceae bacterium]